MTSLIAKFALAVSLAVASGLGLIGVSGLIIFADLPTKPNTVLPTQPLSSGTPSLPFTGPR
jgi:hypothetical protein